MPVETYAITGELDGRIATAHTAVAAAEAAHEYATGDTRGPGFREDVEYLIHEGHLTVQGPDVSANVSRTSGPGRAIFFKFDDGREDGPVFFGVDTGTRWNGWVNPRVRSGDRDEIARAVRGEPPACEDAEQGYRELMSLEADPDGWVDLSGLGYMFVEV